MSNDLWSHRQGSKGQNFASPLTIFFPFFSRWRLTTGRLSPPLALIFWFLCTITMFAPSSNMVVVQKKKRKSWLSCYAFWCWGGVGVVVLGGDGRVFARSAALSPLFHQKQRWWTLLVMAEMLGVFCGGGGNAGAWGTPFLAHPIPHIFATMAAVRAEPKKQGFLCSFFF